MGTVSDAERLDFERFLADLSARFVSVPTATVDHEIHAALESIGEFMNVDRVIFHEFLEDRSSAFVKHSWAHPGIEPIPVGWFIESRLPQVFALLSNWEVADIPDTGALAASWAVDQQEFRRSGAKAHLSIPFAVGGTSVSCLTFVSVRRPRSWPRPLISRLRLLGEVLANALSRRDTENHLHAALARVRALQERLETENLYLRSEIETEHNWRGIIGGSSVFQRVLRTAEQVAPTDATVLIQGATGTGKELIARAIHARSSRRDRPLVKVNCAALPGPLAESELFGHEKGAFTGAVGQMVGRFELADEGTIFLDEVGDLSSEVQAKLLRVLQEGEFERLGSSQTRSTDVRVLAATSRTLDEDIETDRFRTDLYYRLRVVPIEIPPLRDRSEDIPELVWHFVQKARVKYKKAIRTISHEMLEEMVAYDWPGNVRELENVIERAVVLSTGSELTLPAPLAPRAATTGPAAKQGLPGRDASLTDVERSHITDVLKQCNWKVKGSGNAAERLGLNPSTLRARMKKLGIERPSR